MNIRNISLAVALLLTVPVMAQKTTKQKKANKQVALPVYKQAAQPTEARVADLISRMTVEEKIGQLVCPLGWEMYTKTGKNSVEPSELFKKKMDAAPIGSFWAVLRADPWTQKTLETGLNPGKGPQRPSTLCGGEDAPRHTYPLCRGVSARPHGHRHNGLPHIAQRGFYMEPVIALRHGLGHWS